MGKQNRSENGTISLRKARIKNQLTNNKDGLLLGSLFTIATKCQYGEPEPYFFWPTR
jgi:hypothetical protein